MDSNCFRNDLFGSLKVFDFYPFPCIIIEGIKVDEKDIYGADRS